MTETPQGVKISAYLFLTLALLNVLGGCALDLISGVLAASENDLGSLALYGTISCGVVLFGLLYAAVGYGLLKLQSWARIAAIVLAVLSLCNFPLGTFTGGIVLYFMFQQETTRALS